MPEKICGLCGEDCSARPRTKDKRGRYFCTACYETALAQRRAERVQEEHEILRRERKALLGDSDAPGPDIDPGLISDLLPGVPAAPVAAAAAAASVVARPAALPRSACGNCGALLDATAVICIACGTSVASGKASKTHVAKREPGTSRWWTAPFDLFLRPYTFHSRWTLSMSGFFLGLIVFLGWSGHLVYVFVNRVEWHPRMQAAAIQEATWPIVWAWCAVGAIVVMPILVTIIPWPIYWVRLRLAGERRPGFWRTMRVMLVSQLTFVLPTTAVMAYISFNTEAGATVAEEMPDEFQIVRWARIGLMFFSIWVSFWGVRAVFETKLWRAILLFLVGPWMLIAGAWMVVIVLNMIFGAAIEAHEAQAEAAIVEEGRPANSFRYERDAIRFYYPRTWRYEESPFGELPSQELWFESMKHEVTVQIVVVLSTESSSAHLDSILATLRRDSGQEMPEETRFTEQGGHTGAGAIVEFDVTETGQKAGLRAFVTEIRPGLLLEMQEMYTLEDEVKERAGLEMVRETLVFVVE